MTGTGALDDTQVAIELDGAVATVEIRRGPNNYFNPTLIRTLGDEFERLDADPACRAIVLCSEGRHFCAGADFTGEMAEPGASGRLYEEAVRLFAIGTPVVAAVQGRAIGGGVGLALAADFRVAARSSRFTVNFARLGFHQGFGLSVTVPAAVGEAHAARLLYSGGSVTGEEAARIGPMLSLLVERIIDDRPHPEQGYRSCLGIIGLAKRFGADRLEAAAVRALEIQARNYPSVKSILEKGLDKVPVSKAPEREPILHDNIRGSQYYH